MILVNGLIKNIYDALNNVVPNKSFYYEAPVGTALPFCVFSFITIVDDYDSVSKLHDTLLQVSVFSKTQSELETLVQNIVNALDNNEGAIVIPAYDTLRLEKKSARFSKSNRGCQADLDFLIIISN